MNTSIFVVISFVLGARTFYHETRKNENIKKKENFVLSIFRVFVISLSFLVPAYQGYVYY